MQSQSHRPHSSTSPRLRPPMRPPAIVSQQQGVRPSRGQVQLEALGTTRRRSSVWSTSDDDDEKMSSHEALGTTRRRSSVTKSTGGDDDGQEMSSHTTTGTNRDKDGNKPASSPTFEFGAAVQPEGTSAGKFNTSTSSSTGPFLFGGNNAAPVAPRVSLSSSPASGKSNDNTMATPATPATTTATATFARSNSTAFESLTKEHIRPLIELNDQINALTSKENKINSTRIVVAGDQSHGKTSLLEALSGVDLPRGEGIQTRVPLVLQLRAASFGDEHATIRLESSEGEPERISFDDVGRKVREYTQTAAGAGKDIKDEPIELKIFRNDQDDLTLIDLPGITRLALSDQAGGDSRKLESMILDMYRTYMEPEQSILLNVVSAMVDFSTSASLQLSRELDPTGERTMLCVTKVDQHKERGLGEKINAAIDMMQLDSDHVFAVRNRSQKENDDAVALDEVRRMEERDLEMLSRDSQYGLGVGALSKQLVKIQYEQIVQTLPRARAAIYEQIKELQRDLDKLGQPVGDATACRAKVMHSVEASISELQNEVLGRATQPLSDSVGVSEGMMIEVSLVVDNLEAEREKVHKSTNILSASKKVGDFQFILQVYPQNKNKKSDEVPVGVYWKIVAPGIEVISLVASCSVTAVAGECVFTRDICSFDFAEAIPKGSARGMSSFIKADEANEVDGPITFQGSIFIEKLLVEKKKKLEAGEGQNVLLCAQLNELQDELVSSVDKLYSNHYFFSTAFRKKLAHEVSACRGGVGLPGAIAPHVPVNVLKALRQKLPDVVKEYREGVRVACVKKVNGLVDTHFESKLYPKLNELIMDKCDRLFEQQASNLLSHHALILEWEESVCSSNHYFMDTVQSIRSSLSDDEEYRPPYLKHLSDEIIKLMSNEDQRIIDMQIEIFAYWKLMKKRLVDYIIMSTHSELVNKPIDIMLKPILLEATMSRGDKELVKLLSADASILRKRAELSARLDRLLKARASLEVYDERMQQSWCG